VLEKQAHFGGLCLDFFLIIIYIVINTHINIMTVEQQKKTPVEHYYYSEDEWNRLGCGPLPPERDRGLQSEHVKGNPGIDGKNIKGYN
jgi:hypothetical protein